jgi:hypothetical protein
MTKIFIPVVAIAFLTVPILAGQKAKPRTDSAALIARGKYLVEGIAMCGDCHTPHNEKGEPIKEQWLKGAVLDFKPIVSIPVWADKAVNIAGLPGWGERCCYQVPDDRSRPQQRSRATAHASVSLQSAGRHRYCDLPEILGAGEIAYLATARFLGASI